ncbi:hypothetical protein THIOM_001574 [Candidatus Thiomargarita nelsonii]|uniref:Uncharacterized protein n=1 Tax=Candidatus Thiomargarita nelsonii TaxID=1003181 RepID=A0A176S3C7_9GAMM|nr:hypothetical protein THIOM_001574 [Candidatus Thiomargarita nelsonii]
MLPLDNFFRLCYPSSYPARGYTTSFLLVPLACLTCKLRLSPIVRWILSNCISSL